MWVKEKIMYRDICFIDIISVLLIRQTDRSVLGSLVIANYITLTIDSETSIRRGKDHNMLFVKLSQEVCNKMPMFTDC